MRAAFSFASAMGAAVALVACGDEPPPEPEAPVRSAVAAEAPPLDPATHKAKKKTTPPPPPGGLYTCNEQFYCTCTGDAACNRMFEETDCHGGNSTCWEQTNSCHCHLDAAGEVFWE